MAMRVILNVISGPIKGQTFEFGAHDMFLFGRQGDCHARITKDFRVSRHHFILEVNPPELRIRDLGSLNGTFVNDFRLGINPDAPQETTSNENSVVSMQLHDGDRISVGKTCITVHVEPPQPTCSGEIALPKTEKIALHELMSAASDVDHDQSAAVGRAAGTPRGSRSQVRPSTNLSGLRDRIEGYELKHEIGRGGMGVVFLATRVADGQRVALKLMRARISHQPQARLLFQREIETNRQLRHANVAAMLESGMVGDTFFFAMEFCNGGSIASLLTQSGGTLELESAAPIFRQTLTGLAFAHQQKFVHRDITPRNILLHDAGSRRVAKISDFGLSKNFELAGLSGMTATGAFAGTYHYVPREQVTDFKYARPACDVWGLAASYYRMLTGSPPRECPEGQDPITVVLQNDAIPIQERQPNLPIRIAKVIDRALATNVDRRYSDATELKSALNKALSSEGF